MIRIIVLLGCLLLSGVTRAQFIYSPLPQSPAETKVITASGFNHCEVYHVVDSNEVLVSYAAYEKGRPVLFSERGTNDAGDSVTTSTTFYTHDSKGRLRKTITEELGGDEVLTSYEYDAAGRLVTKRMASIDPPTYRYTYDAAGRIKRLDITQRMPVMDKNGEPTGKAADIPWQYCTYRYDAKGRMLSETQYSRRGQQSGPQWIHSWRYDDKGRVVVHTGTNMEGAEVFRSNYTYDKKGLLATSEETTADGTARYVYRWFWGQ